jgi:hypothetical protein
MHFLQRLFYSLFTTQYFIATVAVLLSIETSIVLQQPFLSKHFYLLVFFATHFAYNVYYIHTENGQMHKVLASISCISGLFVLFYIPRLFYPKLFFIAVPSALYILPIFFKFEINRGLRFFKLLLLILVWVATTFILPISKLSFHSPVIVLLLYRVVLLSFACILFFIRDECDQGSKRIASIAAWILLLLQILLAVMVTIILNVEVGLCYLGIGMVNIILGIRFLNTNQSNLKYQMFVDGVLFLQGFIITIIYFLKLS